MTVLAHPTALTFPYPTPPEPGSVMEIAPGILWLRLALPYRLDHVNVYLIEDGAGWAVLDTGLDDTVTRAAWDMLLDGTLHGRSLTRVLVTHYHPDHIGLAGWLCERFGLPLLMSQTEDLVSLSIHLEPGALNAEPYRSFYRSHGLDSETTERLLTSGHRYLRMISGLPRTFRRLIAGELLRIGGRTFEVLSGGGHIQHLVNPPGNPKAHFRTGPVAGHADAWLADSSQQAGSWWPHWADWAVARSGEERPAPKRLGSRRNRPIEPAPGRYVMER